MKAKEENSFLSRAISPALLSDAREIRKNLPYASLSKSEKLDVYFPKNGVAPYPVLIYFHGGAFRFGEKDDSSLEPMLRGLKKGYVVVSVGYRLSGEARFPAMVYDGKCALRYLHKKAKEWNLDENRFALWGPSSGGWLVSFLALSEKNPAFEDLNMGYASAPTSVAAVIDWCGPVSGFV